MTASRVKVLVVGYGNPGRLDDGLGPAFAEMLEHKKLAGVKVESNYQLVVEDAATMAACDAVLFADASTNCTEPFELKAVGPKRPTSFSSHSVQPEALLALAKDLFGAETRGYVLGIRGYEFNEFGESLSNRAAENLRRAIDFMVPVLESGQLDQAARKDDGPES